MELHEAMSHIGNPVLIFVKLMSRRLVPPLQSLPYNVFVCSNIFLFLFRLLTFSLTQFHFNTSIIQLGHKPQQNSPCY